MKAGGVLAEMADRFAEQDRRRMEELERAIAEARKAKKPPKTSGDTKIPRKVRQSPNAKYRFERHAVAIDGRLTIATGSAMLTELDSQKKRLHRSRAWLLRRAWEIALPEIRKLEP